MNILLIILPYVIILILALVFYVYETKYSFRHFKLFSESEDTKEFKRKVNLIVENARTIEQTNSSFHLLNNILDVYKEEYRIFNPKVSDEMVNFMFMILENYMKVSIIERQAHLIQRKLNEKVI